MDNELIKLVGQMLSLIDRKVNETNRHNDAVKRVTRALTSLTGKTEFDIIELDPNDPLSSVIESNLAMLDKLNEEPGLNEFELKTLSIIRAFINDTASIILDNNIKGLVANDRIVDAKKKRGSLVIDKETEADILHKTHTEYEEWFSENFSSIKTPEPKKKKIEPTTIAEPYVRIDWYDDVRESYMITATGKLYQYLKFRTCMVPLRTVSATGEFVVNLTHRRKVYLSHLVWEAYHPEFRNMEYSLTYKDGNCRNCNLKNLVLATNNEMDLK